MRRDQNKQEGREARRALHWDLGTVNTVGQASRKVQPRHPEASGGSSLASFWWEADQGPRALGVPDKTSLRGRVN